MEYLLWILIPLALLTLWLAIFAVLAWFSGWRALAARYRATAPPAGERFRMQSARFNWVDYNGCLTICAGADGLYFALPRIFGFAHPPLLIPWSALHVEKVREGWLLRDVVLAVDDAPRARIRIPLKVAEAARKLRPAGDLAVDADSERVE